MIFVYVLIGALLLWQVFTAWRIARGRKTFWAAMKSFEAAMKSFEVELKHERKMRELLGKRLFRVQDSWSDHLMAHKAEEREKEGKGETEKEEEEDEPSSG